MLCRLLPDERNIGEAAITNPVRPWIGFLNFVFTVLDYDGYNVPQAANQAPVALELVPLPTARRIRLARITHGSLLCWIEFGCE